MTNSRPTKVKSNSNTRMKFLRKFSKSSSTASTTDPVTTSLGSSIGSTSTASVASLASHRNHFEHAQRTVQIIEQALRDIEHLDADWEDEFFRWKEDWRNKIGRLSFENVLKRIYDDGGVRAEDRQIDGISMNDESDADSYRSGLTATTPPDNPLYIPKDVSTSAGSRYSEIELPEPFMF